MTPSLSISLLVTIEKLEFRNTYEVDMMQCLHMPVIVALDCKPVRQSLSTAYFQKPIIVDSRL